MQITTSKGQTYDATTFLITWDGCLVIAIQDTDSKLSELAEAFEGLEWVEMDSKRYDNVTTLRSVTRVSVELVQVRLAEGV